MKKQYHIISTATEWQNRTSGNISVSMQYLEDASKDFELISWEHNAHICYIPFQIVYESVIYSNNCPIGIKDVKEDYRKRYTEYMCLPLSKIKEYIGSSGL